MCTRVYKGNSYYVILYQVGKSVVTLLYPCDSRMTTVMLCNVQCADSVVGLVVRSRSDNFNNYFSHLNHTIGYYMSEIIFVILVVRTN